MADHRHKRDTDARRLFGAVTTTKTVSAGFAALATTTVIAVGVLSAPISHDLVAADAVVAADAAAGRPTMSASADARDRFVVSRSASRKQSAQDKQEAVREARCRRRRGRDGQGRPPRRHQALDDGPAQPVDHVQQRC